MTDSQAIADIARVLITHGPVFSGGDQRTAERIAAEWHDHGFDADETDQWCSAGCWDASVAAEFHESHMTPRAAAKACEAFDAKYGQTRGSDSMYAACNEDLDAQSIISLYKAS